jgi:hypothetical protein
VGLQKQEGLFQRPDKRSAATIQSLALSIQLFRLPSSAADEGLDSLIPPPPHAGGYRGSRSRCTLNCRLPALRVSLRTFLRRWMVILPQTNNLKSNVGMGGYGVVGRVGGVSMSSVARGVFC